MFANVSQVILINHPNSKFLISIYRQYQDVNHALVDRKLTKGPKSYVLILALWGDTCKELYTAGLTFALNYVVVASRQYFKQGKEIP